jgi:hypothetical protein
MEMWSRKNNATKHEKRRQPVAVPSHGLPEEVA